MGGATSFKPCMLISSPSPPLRPLPSLPSHPILPSVPFPSLPVPGGGSQSHLPLPFPPLPLPLPPGVPLLNQLGGLRERYKFPQWGLGQSPSLQTIWCISGIKRSSSGGNSFCAFHKNRCNFLRL